MTTFDEALHEVTHAKTQEEAQEKASRLDTPMFAEYETSQRLHKIANDTIMAIITSIENDQEDVLRSIFMSGFRLGLKTGMTMERQELPPIDLPELSK